MDLTGRGAAIGGRRPPLYCWAFTCAANQVWTADCPLLKSVCCCSFVSPKFSGAHARGVNEDGPWWPLLVDIDVVAIAVVQQRMKASHGLAREVADSGRSVANGLFGGELYPERRPPRRHAIGAVEHVEWIVVEHPAVDPYDVISGKILTAYGAGGGAEPHWLEEERYGHRGPHGVHYPLISGFETVRRVVPGQADTLPAGYV